MDAIKALWNEFVALRAKVGKSRQIFLDRHFSPLLKSNADRFVDEDGRRLDTPLHIHDSDGKALERFAKSGGERAQSDSFMRSIEGFVACAAPDRFVLLMPQRSTDTVGEIFGVFLRDPKSFDARINLALDKQRLVGLYSYAAKDTAGWAEGSRRYLAFLAGETVDYLLALDFHVTDEMINRGESMGADWSEEVIRLYYGFCAPGSEFSPVIMRSLCMGERAVGLFYTPNSLVDFDSDALQQLRFDIFTTDRLRFGFRQGETGSDFEAARLITAGPRLRYVLDKVKSVNTISILQKRIAQFKMEFL